MAAEVLRNTVILYYTDHFNTLLHMLLQYFTKQATLIHYYSGSMRGTRPLYYFTTDVLLYYTDVLCSTLLHRRLYYFTTQTTLIL
jgi:hypothetical protein